MAATINISLPEPLRAYVDAQTAAGDYGAVNQSISTHCLSKQEHDQTG